ncbi:MAG: signal peptidase I [Clostridia bacterium]|jgi:signal peptidase I|nr:signal peptidase I [Clostridia bacterium]
MKSNIKEIIEWIICIVIAVILALSVRYYIGTPTIVQQTSMHPTLKDGERLWLNRWARTIKKMPERGDIITFEAPSMVQVPEEEVDLKNPVAKYDKKIEGPIAKFKYYVLESGKKSYIKRVIGLPGDYVEIKDGAVYINGEKLEEKYLQDGVVTDMLNGNREESHYTNFTVPENHVYALGDNRTGSVDCRAFGCIPLEKIEGKVAFRFWPLSQFGGVD